MLTFNANKLDPQYTTSIALHFKARYQRSLVKPRDTYPTLLKFAMPNVDVSQLLASTLDSMNVFGNWNYRIGKDANGDTKVDHGYGGIGLSYNPNMTNSSHVNIHQQVQGNDNPGARGLDGSNPFSRLSGTEGEAYSIKNSHYDTYGFCYRTPASKHTQLGEFLDTCKRTMVRSAVRIIYADQDGQVGDNKLAGVRWHTDEPMFENLRINIPLLTDPIFVLEQEGQPAAHLETGYAYSWDTGKLHCAYATTRPTEPKQRIHLMLGFSCWWDFDEATGNWSQNEFFGKKHPLDMLADGDVIPGLKLQLT